MKKIVSIGIQCASLACAACASTAGPCRDADTRAQLAPQQQTAESGVLVLHVEPKKQGEVAAVRITLLNVGDRILWVNGRLLIFDQTSPFREVWLDVEHVTTHERLAVTCSSGAGSAVSSDYLRLTPGASFSVIRELTCFPFTERGPWRIVAHYQDANTAPPPPPRAASWFTGSLVSNAIEVEVGPALVPRESPSSRKESGTPD